MKVSDYIIEFLVKKGVRDIFLVSGGGIMHLCDSVGKNKKLRYISNHHEQASAMCAEGYARVNSNIGACLVTTGPGGTNAFTGVAGAWTDSIPMIVISGQVRTDIIADYKKLRQLGPQELNIVAMAKHITKYAVTIKNPKLIRYELEKAHFIATSGRPGPVWIDVPLDIQGASIDARKLQGFTQKKKKVPEIFTQQIKKTIQLLKKAKRPVLILGHGVRLAHAEKQLQEFIKKVRAPILLPYNGLDLVPHSESLLVGKFGPVGNRAGNFVLQNADLLLVIGASLSLASRGFDLKGFAPRAKKIMVDIDKGELTKPTVSLNLAINSDAKIFIKKFLELSAEQTFSEDQKWHDVWNNWKKKYPQIIPEFLKDTKHVNTYIFFDILSDVLNPEDIVLTGNSLDAVSLFQAYKVKRGQRAFTNANLGAMGWCLPASIGACVAHDRKRTILVTGDGSIQFNIQELATVSYYHLPLKIFVVNNEGYESIRTTQSNFFKEKLVGSDKNSGVTNPNFKKLAATYNIKYAFVKNNKQIKTMIKKVLNTDGPVLCELNVHPDQHRIPKATSFRKADGTLESRPLEDMAPFLPRKEILENMHLFDKK